MIEFNDQSRKTNGTLTQMILFLETIHEHALAIDFSVFVLIWLVHLVIYPSFKEIDPEHFPRWHATYCNRISFFVLPLMGVQLMEAASSCFFVGRVWEWVRLGAVVLAWGITFLHSARCHRKLSQVGKEDSTIDSLLRGNLWRSLAWTLAFLASWVGY